MTGFSFRQQQVQKQLQVLSQKQLQSLSVLSLSSQELYDRLDKFAQENPAFTLTKLHRTSTKTSSSVSRSGQESSDNFQSVLESRADTRESLTHHLMTQLNSMNLTESEAAFGTTIIHHLDNHGFLIYDPVSLLDKKDKNQTPALAGKMVKIIQALEPTGTCTRNFQESLFVQAKLSTKKNDLALFILDGHFDFLDPFQPLVIQKKIKTYLNQQKKLFELKEAYSKLDTSVESVEEALLFIQKLDPYPAANYSTESLHYVEPDVTITKSEERILTDDFENGIVNTKNHTFIVKTSWQTNYRGEIDEQYTRLSQTKKLSREEARKINEDIRRARDFIDSLTFRQNTVLAAMCHILKKQSQFFDYGPGHLKELRQKDLAKILHVHETTVSRMANSKFIQCDWGFFPVKHFFTNAVKNVSRDKILHEIQQIIEEHKIDSKRLSDIQLCSCLEERGIKIARRTVAKYRGLLNIESSFKR